MHYVKKMCILRQVKQGFSGDGKTLSGLVKIEQYGKNLAVEVSVINFAPLSSGEYYCLLADSHGKTELLALRGKSLFNILTDMELENGFCAVICFVKNEITPIAYGVNGDKQYDWKQILAATIPPSFSAKPTPVTHEDTATALTREEPQENDYNDERLANENYYKEQESGQELLQETIQNARTESASEKQDEKTGADVSENVYAENVLHPFATEPDGYYLSVKTEIDELLTRYPKDDTLCGAFSCSEWVRVKGEAENPQYLVGVVYDDGKARYICYALAAQDKNNPPEEIKDVCAFVPSRIFDDEKGFFVIFQSAATGECVKPFRA
ncbi:MAG: hypothetical protein IJ329_00845 [Clostridia bacterium]|nr:hypothetical protein [Clostridia bacterium]